MFFSVSDNYVGEATGVRVGLGWILGRRQRRSLWWWLWMFPESRIAGRQEVGDTSEAGGQASWLWVRALGSVFRLKADEKSPSLSLTAATQNAGKHSHPKMLRFLQPCLCLHTQQSLPTETNMRMGASHPASIMPKSTVYLKTVVLTRFSVHLKDMCQGEEMWGTYKIMMVWLLLKVFLSLCVMFLKQKCKRQNSLFMPLHMHTDMTV